jgi:hypothetical protein
VSSSSIWIIFGLVADVPDFRKLDQDATFRQNRPTAELHKKLIQRIIAYQLAIDHSHKVTGRMTGLHGEPVADNMFTGVTMENEIRINFCALGKSNATMSVAIEAFVETEKRKGSRGVEHIFTDDPAHDAPLWIPHLPHLGTGLLQAPRDPRKPQLDLFDLPNVDSVKYVVLSRHHPDASKEHVRLFHERALASKFRAVSALKTFSRPKFDRVGSGTLVGCQFPLFLPFPLK